ncbi:CDP-diacylglycerol--serine O-phosphatidyltransferase [Balneola sp. MJW-20]|uniref:CDP-diacylglycerol--serine O-phosphatidyltransferase n=1 Tax=Gracilimonas aurantiaca TaxID=3234185 RepID=UPI0034658E52
MKYPIQKKYHKFREVRKKRKEAKPPVNKRVAVPSFFTLMNLFSGFLAIISIADGELERGAWLIALAGLFDVFDGMMARLANATSDFGIELDSICDMVSFGVAPGFLIYTWSLNELGFVGIIISALPPLCGAIRLARFNVNARLQPSKEHFIGLPIPAQAIILGSFFLTFDGQTSYFNDFQYGINSVIVPAVLIVSVLMVSTIPFDKIPRFDRVTLKKRKGDFILFIIYLLLIIFFRQYGLIAVFTIFLLKGVITGAIHFIYDDFLIGKEEFQDYS